MCEQDSPKARESDIGRSRQLCFVEPEPEAYAVQRFAQDDLRLGVNASDARHHPAANGSRDDVSHLLLSARGRAV